MSENDVGQTKEITDVPVAWEALEDAFENNAPEVHSYLHFDTGEVIRVVDGVADPATVSYTHLTLPTKVLVCRSRWSPYH